jgi:hypothetical protein
MASFQQLEGRLDEILRETAPPEGPKASRKADAASSDSFVVLKAAIAARCREMHESIKHRDALGDVASVEAVYESAGIRRAIAAAEAELGKLEALHAKAHEKADAKRESPETPLGQKLALRDEAIKGLRDNLDFCRELEKHRLGVVLPLPGSGEESPATRASRSWPSGTGKSTKGWTASGRRSES